MVFKRPSELPLSPQCLRFLLFEHEHVRSRTLVIYRSLQDTDDSVRTRLPKPYSHRESFTPIFLI